MTSIRNNDNRNERRRVIYIIGHIPPAMGSFRHSQLWQESYARRYYQILDMYKPIIAGQFFAHLHSDEFRLIRSTTTISSVSSSEDDDDNMDTSTNTTTKDDNNDNNKTFTIASSSSYWSLWLASSITPIYGSNPSIRIVSYSKSTGALIDYDTYYLSLFGQRQQEDEQMSNSSSSTNSADDGSSIDDNANNNNTLLHNTTTKTNENNNATILEEPEWIHGPSFLQSFELKDMSITSLQSLIQRLNQSIQVSIDEEEESAWQTMLTRQHVHADDDDPSSSSCSDIACRQGWMCVLTTITTAEFNTCLGQQQQDTRQLGRLAVIGVIGLSITLGLAVLCVIRQRCVHRRQQRRQQRYLRATMDLEVVEEGHDDEAQQQPPSTNVLEMMKKNSNYSTIATEQDSSSSAAASAESSLSSLNNHHRLPELS